MKKRFPQPAQGAKLGELFHWYEMCDAVQDEKYKVDGIYVSNFLLPLYFTRDPEVGGRNDFLGKLHEGKPLESFGINPGGYVGFYNPKSGNHETFALRADARAKERLAIKGKAQLTRRSMRYKSGMRLESRVEAEAARATRPSRRVQRRRSRPSRPVAMIDAAQKRPELG
jgi:hypothetical protein